eukprot:TRINITY_DN1217_c0_g1_i2.p1 TRINITY_DN1217_c0_g1~~TRINITY_DN1217_c0_g1_i2.p1  ORF type:complete len:178 (-),score=13.35 TRINITY_DN1217_c0_g1_i2:1567-2100(-)
MAAEREARCVLELEQARAGALRQTDAHEHGSAPGASASTDEGGGGFSEEGQVRSQEARGENSAHHRGRAAATDEGHEQVDDLPDYDAHSPSSSQTTGSATSSVQRVNTPQRVRTPQLRTSPALDHPIAGHCTIHERLLFVAAELKRFNNGILASGDSSFGIYVISMLTQTLLRRSSN